MSVLRTTTCCSHGHPEFKLTFDPAIVSVADDVQWFIDWLEHCVAEGTRFTPGETVQVGWGILEVRNSEDGSLPLWEPNMREMPIVWTESISNTLAHLRLQKDVVESVLSPSDLSFPSMLESAIICTRFGQSKGLVMERGEPAGADSGWFCGCRERDHDHNNVADLRRVSLYEAMVRYSPEIVPYLALPPGILIGVSNGAPAIFRNGDPLAFKPNSLLATKCPSL